MKVMEDREVLAELMREKNDVYEHLPRDAAELLRIFAKIDMEIEEDEEEINMCRAIDEMVAEAREDGREVGIRLGEKTGREIGRKEGRENLITNIMRNFSGPAHLLKKSAVLSRRRISPGISCASSGRRL